MGDVATGLATHASIDATTSLGAVSLTVSDLDGCTVMGLQRDGASAHRSVGPRRPRNRTG